MIASDEKTFMFYQTLSTMTDLDFDSVHAGFFNGICIFRCFIKTNIGLQSCEILWNIFGRFAKMRHIFSRKFRTRVRELHDIPKRCSSSSIFIFRLSDTFKAWFLLFPQSFPHSPFLSDFVWVCERFLSELSPTLV